MSQPDTIDHLLSHQQEQLELLLSLLQQEYSALSRRESTILIDVLNQKQHCLTTIMQLDPLLAESEQLSEIKSEDWFKQRVDDVQQLLSQCQQQSQINSQVVEQSQLVIERLKTELLQSRGRTGLTYNAKGKPAQVDKGPGIKA